jgi:hypothetical protein
MEEIAISSMYIWPEYALKQLRAVILRKRTIGRLFLSQFKPTWARNGLVTELHVASLAI